MNCLKSLNKFVKSGFYSKNVTHSIGTALRVLGEEASKDETKSISSLESNLDRIAQRLLKKGRGKVTEKTLATYKIRLKRLIKDYNNGPSIKIQNKELVQYQKIELKVRPDAKIVLSVPKDLTFVEKEVIKSLIDSLGKKK